MEFIIYNKKININDDLVKEYEKYFSKLTVDKLNDIIYISDLKDCNSIALENKINEIIKEDIYMLKHKNTKNIENGILK